MKKFLKYAALVLFVFWLLQQTGLDEIIEKYWYKAQESGLVEKVIDGAGELGQTLKEAGSQAITSAQE